MKHDRHEATKTIVHLITVILLLACMIEGVIIVYNQ